MKEKSKIFQIDQAKRVSDQAAWLKLKRTEPGVSILLLKLTKLTNLTKPKLMKKNVMQM